MQYHRISTFFQIFPISKSVAPLSVILELTHIYMYNYTYIYIVSGRKKTIKDLNFQVCAPFMWEFRHQTWDLFLWGTFSARSSSCHTICVYSNCCKGIDIHWMPKNWELTVATTTPQKRGLLRSKDMHRWVRTEGNPLGKYVSNVIQSNFALVICSNRSGGYRPKRSLFVHMSLSLLLSFWRTVQVAIFRVHEHVHV